MIKIHVYETILNSSPLFCPFYFFLILLILPLEDDHAYPDLSHRLTRQPTLHPWHIHEASEIIYLYFICFCLNLLNKPSILERRLE